MTQRTNQTTEIPADKFVTIPCRDCNRQTRHKILALTDVRWDDRDVTFGTEYQIAECQGCLNVSFYESSTCSEEYYHDENGDCHYLVSEQFYPNRLVGRPLMQDAEALPSSVRAIYREAHGAFCANLPILAGLGIRAVVEAVCKDRRIAKGDLKQKIDELATQGLITKDGATILHRLRFMGNAAAHEMKAHSSKELNAGFEVAEHLMHGVYILPKRAADLPKEKAKRKKRS